MRPDMTTLRNDFARTGFAIAPNLFERSEVQRLKLECIDILEAAKAETGTVAGHGVYVGLAARSPVFQDAVGDARLLDILAGILAPDIEFLSDKVVFKSESMDFASPWHQDWHYWHGAHKLSIWVALDDATVENGCLKLFPGSHKSAIVHDGDAGDGHGFGNRLRPGAVDESRAVTAELEAGGAVFFHDLTLHASHPNRSGAERWVWIPTYRDANAEDSDYPWAVAAKVLRGEKITVMEEGAHGRIKVGKEPLRQTATLPHYFTSKKGTEIMFKNLSTGAIGIRANMKEGLALAKNAGFEGLDLDIGEASQLAEEHSVQYVTDLWAEAGIAMGGWGFGVNWRGADAEYYAGLAQLPARAALAAELGCYRTTTVVGPASNDMTYQENWDFSVKRLRPVAEILKAHGHSIGLEFIGPATSRKASTYLFAYSMDAMLGLAAAVGTGNVGLLFDTWHWYTCRSTVDDVRKLSTSDVVYVHINDAPAGIDADDQIDNIRCLPAETGVIPLTELMHILTDIGYEGPVTPEPFSQKVNGMAPADAAKATAESLGRVWANAGL